MTRHEILVRLRNLNHELVKLSLAEFEDARQIESGIARHVLDDSRQGILVAIRTLDPESARDPVIEEVDVAKFHIQAEGAGSLLMDKITGRENRN